ncbi:hypothetical protein AOA80_11085 [Methanomassiliicoccales archaeon RumEn M1]|nr:hypothetical protein AOA80_11085 [Methanomassiliicoccales archaeon RumEn M1]
MVLAEIAVLLIGPLLVGLSMGLDRKLTARLQNRRGPPLLQPFYDIAKLLSKRPQMLGDLQGLFALFCVAFQAVAFGLFAFGGDLVVAFFVSSMGAVFLVLGAYSAPSPYSHLGANRELLALLAYEPVLFMVIMAVGINGSFLISEVPPGLLERIPLALVALLPVLVILLEKSPYDVPAAHQELATGPYVEYSGPYLALLELARWYQLAFVYGIATLFIWGPRPAGDVALKLLLAFALLFAAILIDNTTARLTRRRMVLFTLTAGVGLIALNLIVLYLAGVI